MSQNTIVIFIFPPSLKIVKIVGSSHGPYKTRQWTGFGPRAESVAHYVCGPENKARMLLFLVSILLSLGF